MGGTCRLNPSEALKSCEGQLICYRGQPLSVSFFDVLPCSSLDACTTLSAARTHSHHIPRRFAIPSRQFQQNR